AGLLQLLPGLFTDYLGLLLLLPPDQKQLTVKMMPHLPFTRMPGAAFSAATGRGNTIDGEYQRKEDERDRLDHKDDRQDKSRN
ncbi:FxsA family protein, partial [Escherichia coli]|uniref:FxsA family protein n=1 Tax=Escherichia coli TaxID=562 RepID=UPI002FBECC82